MASTALKVTLGVVVGVSALAALQDIGKSIAPVATAEPIQSASISSDSPESTQPQQPTEEQLKEAKEAKEKADRIASGEHCLSGWDGSFPRLKEAVKRSLRNPDSFDHMETVRSPVDGKGKFGLIMTYRAENGFGGMNVEAAGVEVDAETCDFEQASAASLAKRLRSKS